MRPFAEPFTGVAINCETPNCPASPISTGNALADPHVNVNAWNRRALPAEDVRAGALDAIKMGFLSAAPGEWLVSDIERVTAAILRALEGEP
jgi:hypothetical protein